MEAQGKKKERLSRYVAVILLRRLGHVSEAICSVPAEIIAKY